MYQRCLLLDVGAGYKLYPGMEPGKSFSGTRCEDSEGVCVGDGKENRESSKGKAEKMIYIGLVDDECEHLMKMRTFLLQYEEEHNTKFSIQEFHNGLNFVEDYKGDLDIVFLDIEMPQMDGMTAARKIREKDSKLGIIFVTNMAQYAINGYEVNAVDFNNKFIM